MGDPDEASTVVVCDMGPVTHPDAGTIDALARLQLIARRDGVRLHLLNTSQELRELLALTGLSDVLPLCPGLPGRVGRQAEEREQPIGVEEGDHPTDPIP